MARATTVLIGGSKPGTGTPVMVRFDRRRYGVGPSGMSYTWGTVTAPDGSALSLGDPWPVETPKRADLTAAVEAALVGWSVERMARSGAKPFGPGDWTRLGDRMVSWEYLSLTWTWTVLY